MMITTRIFFLSLIIIAFNSCVEPNKKSEKKGAIGKISKDNKRIGKWEYYTEEGDFLASGHYNNGLKEGKWTYNDITYNKTQKIIWSTFSNELFIVNLPEDWISTRYNKYVPLKFEYNIPDSYNLKPNGNISIIEKNSDINFSDYSKKIIEYGKINKTQKVTLEKETEINNKKAFYTQQILTIEEEEVFIEQYVVKGNVNNYLLSFLVNSKQAELYHQLFTEIAYSFSEN